MKILFATMPADGHFNPLTGVAMHLKAAGHDVRWYAAPSYIPRLERLGIGYFPFIRATEVIACVLSGLGYAPLVP
jgi:UDP:flavonoid glycosyltransferase YjiC (YdhE family)